MAYSSYRQPPYPPQAYHMPQAVGNYRATASNMVDDDSQKNIKMIMGLIFPIILCCFCIISCASCYLSREKICSSKITSPYKSISEKTGDFKYSIASLSCFSGASCLCLGPLLSIPFFIC